MLLLLFVAVPLQYTCVQGVQQDVNIDPGRAGLTGRVGELSYLALVPDYFIWREEEKDSSLAQYTYR